MSFFDFLGDAADAVGGVLGDVGKVALPIWGVQSVIGSALFGRGDPNVAALNIQPPPLAPDITDEAITKARLAAIRRQVMGGGLSSMFVSGALGDASRPATSSPRAGGY